MDIPIGTILINEGKFFIQVRDGLWLTCDGKSLPKKEYKELYKVLKGAYGSSRGEFNLPDLGGRFVEEEPKFVRIMKKIIEEDDESNS